MKYHVTTKEGFDVIGVEIQTNTILTEKEMSTLWQKFITQNILDKIPNKANIYPEVFYYAASNEPLGTETSYSCLIGCKVTDLTTIPLGMTGKKIPTSKYAVFTCVGDFPISLKNCWREINETDLKRTYLHDIESYKHFQAPDHEVNIFVGIK